MGDFNTSFSSMDRLLKQKINKQTQILNDTLIDIYRVFHPKAAEYTFFTSAHGTFSRIDHMLGNKGSLGVLRTSKSYQATFLTTTL